MSTKSKRGFDGDTFDTQDDAHVSENDEAQAGHSIVSPAKLKMAGDTIAPFLSKHIPEQYAPVGIQSEQTDLPAGNVNTKYCYRHRPDLKCRRQADEQSMKQLQKGLETLSQADQQAIAHVWSLFSAAPAKHRNLILQGILTQCCFPQLSYLSVSVRELIRIDFLAALPPELSFKILCYLDTTSLCKAAQVSRTWRSLADDDVVWHRMCEQHIDRKCVKCGWGLPLLERKRLRATKREIELRATGRASNRWSPEITALSVSNGAHQPNATLEAGIEGKLPQTLTLRASTPDRKRASPDIVSDRSESTAKRRCARLMEAEHNQRNNRPWKDIYRDRFRVGTNWKYGRCSIKIFKGHTNGVMCLQFDENENILATGSYDATIKIWDLKSGKELRTLVGHELPIRALQFDDTKLISGSLDKTLKCWNWRTGECMSTYRGHSGGVIGLHFESTLLASGSQDKTIKVWNFEDKSTYLLRGHTDWVNHVRIHFSSRTLFSASDDDTVRLWDLNTRTCLRVFRGHVGQVQQVEPLPPEFELDDLEKGTKDEGYSPGFEGEESGAGKDHEWCPHTADMAHQIEEPSTNSSAITSVQDHVDDGLAPPRYMLTSALDSTIRLWDVASGRCLRTFFGHVEGVWALAADTVRMVSGAEDRMVKIWDARTGKCERTFTGHMGPVTCIGLSGSRMCTGSEDCEVRMYSFAPDD
ncbi:MAG: hypothetical protein M1816_002699 [Peltula sp. TS41687]|nr:MAG: hypothetical protein M1816_002699 [Peltula sp. TS41687]